MKKIEPKPERYHYTIYEYGYPIKRFDAGKMVESSSGRVMIMDINKEPAFFVPANMLIEISKNENPD